VTGVDGEGILATVSMGGTSVTTKADGTFVFENVAAGTYTWAVGLVDTTKENAIGILLSARDEYQTAEGWVKVGDITIQ